MRGNYMHEKFLATKACLFDTPKQNKESSYKTSGNIDIYEFLSTFESATRKQMNEVLNSENSEVANEFCTQFTRSLITQKTKTSQRFRLLTNST